MAQALTSIRTSQDTLEIVNQLLLPHRIEYIIINSVEDAYDAIKTMKIRGAPAIASLAALSFAQYLTRSLQEIPRPEFLNSPNELKNHVLPILSYLYESRPTAVNLGNATKRLNKTLKESIDAGKDARWIAQGLVEEAKKVADEDVGRNKDMAKLGGDWLVERIKAGGETGDQLNVLTVCNTGSLATSVSLLPSVFSMQNSFWSVRVTELLLA
jgi:methylthioribose-1-phosphate isomerase